MFQDSLLKSYQVRIYLLKVNYINTRTRCEICSKLIVKTPERRTYLTPCSSVSIVNFKYVITGWGSSQKYNQKP